MILVTGADGRVGRELLPRLLAADTPVRVLTRRPGQVELPSEVDVVGGDLGDLDSLAPALRGVDSVFLFSMGHTANGFVRAAREAGVRRLVVISGIGDDPDEVERTLSADGPEWTHLWPTAFASNAVRHWGYSIRAEATIRTPYGDAAIAPVHEADIAEVAAAALLHDGHAGRRYELTGPESLTFREQVAILGKAIGTDLTFIEETPAQARERMTRFGVPAPIVDRLLAVWAEATTHPAPVSPTIELVTGHPARSYAQWAEENAAAFH